MRMIERGALVSAVLLLTAPSGALAQDAAEPAAAAAPAFTKGTLGQPAEGKGQVVFFRPNQFTFSALSFKVRENGIEIGKLSNGRYFVVDVEPGVHTYVVHSEVKDELVIEVEPGEVYFVEQGVNMGVLAARPNLMPTDQAKFDAAAPKMKPAA